MLRRDIFNLLFPVTRPKQIDLDSPDPILATPDYLDTEDVEVYGEEWTAPLIPEYLVPEVLTSYAFTITMTTRSEFACLQAGVKNADDYTSATIPVGIDQGTLFIGNLRDTRVLEKEKLAAGVTLVLTVYPRPNGASSARLQVTDQNGLTLSVLKASTYAVADWAGAIHTSAAFTTLHISGYAPLKDQLTTI